MRYDRILGEMFWHIALLGLHLNPGQGAASGEHVDPRRAVVERAGDIHSGETAAENGDRALTAEACPQATEGVSLDNVVSRGAGGDHTPGATTAISAGGNSAVSPSTAIPSTSGRTDLACIG